jgi:hypothetical protein
VKKLDAPVRLKCQVRVESVIAERDRKTYGEKHGQKESDLEPVEPKAPDVSGNRGQRQQEGADEEETRWPVYFIEGDAVEHSRYNSGAVDVSGYRGWALRQALKCLHSVLLQLFAIPTIDLDIIAVVLSLGFLDFEFVGDLFCPTFFGVALNRCFLFLGLDRTTQSYSAINRDNLDILGHHRKRAIANDHLANVRTCLDVGRIIRLIRRGLGLIIAISRVFSGIVRVCVL